MLHYKVCTGRRQHGRSHDAMAQFVKAIGKSRSSSIAVSQRFCRQQQSADLDLGSFWGPRSYKQSQSLADLVKDLDSPICCHARQEAQAFRTPVMTCLVEVLVSAPANAVNNIPPRRSRCGWKTQSMLSKTKSRLLPKQKLSSTVNFGH